MMTAYDTVRTLDSVTLFRTVHAKMLNGWQPHGDLHVIAHEPSSGQPVRYEYVQGIIKYDEVAATPVEGSSFRVATLHTCQGEKTPQGEAELDIATQAAKVACDRIKGNPLIVLPCTVTVVISTGLADTIVSNFKTQIKCHENLRRVGRSAHGDFE